MSHAMSHLNRVESREPRRDEAYEKAKRVDLRIKRVGVGVGVGGGGVVVVGGGGGGGGGEASAWSA